MKSAHEAAMAEFLKEDGEFFGRTLGAARTVPDSVLLTKGKLTIRSVRPYWSRKRVSIEPSPRLLNSFISLADTSGQEIRTPVWTNTCKRSDERILRLAKRYGGLQVFCQLSGRPKWPHTEHVEYCEVWRYFAHAMGALLRIGAEIYRGRAGSKEDWHIVSAVPPVMRETFHSSEPGLLHPFPAGDEENWLILAHYVDKRSQQSRPMFGHLVNTLLGLSGVRPWMTWTDTSRGVARPTMAYWNRSLLAELALQLCLRLVKVDTLLMCIHCQKLYSPVVRAPKTGQRSFCPQCRKDGVPKKYALKDFRQRQKQAGQEKEID